MRNVHIVTRRKWPAVTYDAIAEGIAWLILGVIVVNMMYLPFIVAAIAGNVLGTYFVAGRKLKKKQKNQTKKSYYYKKSQFTSA